MLVVAAADDVRRQLLAGVLLVERHKGPQDHELGLVAAGQVEHRPVGSHAHVAGSDPDALLVDEHQVAGALAGAARILGDRPLGSPLVEVLRVVDVVGAPQFGLDAEQVLGIPEVLDQFDGHLGDRTEEAAEGALVGPDDRIVGIGHVEGDTAVEGVDHSLDRVANVVEPGPKAALRRKFAHRCPLGVRIAVGRRVAVDHVDDPSLMEHRVRIGVEAQEGRQLLDPLPDVADVDDPRVFGDEVRDQGLEFAEPEGERYPPHQRAHRHTALATDVRIANLQGLLVLVGVVDLVPAGSDDGIATELLADINLRLIDRHTERRIDRDGQVADEELGIAGRPNPTHGSEGHAVAMRERHVLALPRAGHVRLELAGTDHHLGRLTADQVPVGVELPAEAVELALALEPVEGSLDDEWIQNPDVADRARAGEEVLAGDHVVHAVQLQHRDVVEAEGLTGRLDVAADVLGLLLGLRRLDPKVLDHRRIDVSHHQGHERPQADGQHRQHPASTPDVDDQQDDGKKRDEDQEVDRRKLRFDVGVGRAVDGTPGRGRQLVAGQPVVGGLHQGEEAEQEREVGLDRRLDPLAHGLESDAAVEVVEHRGHDQRDDQGAEQPSNHKARERHLEDVEADVLAELGVLDAEVAAVGEQQPLLPAVRHAEAGQECQQRRSDDPNHPGPAAHGHVVPGQQVFFGAGWPHDRSEAIGDGQVHEADDEEEGSEQRHQHDLCKEYRPEHVAVAELVEPQVVRVEAGEAAQRQHQDASDDQEPESDYPDPAGSRSAGSTAEGRARGRGWGWGWGFLVRHREGS